MGRLGATGLLDTHRRNTRQMLNGIIHVSRDRKRHLCAVTGAESYQDPPMLVCEVTSPVVRTFEPADADRCLDQQGSEHPR